MFLLMPLGSAGGARSRTPQSKSMEAVMAAERTVVDNLGVVVRAAEAARLVVVRAAVREAARAVVAMAGAGTAGVDLAVDLAVVRAAVVREEVATVEVDSAVDSEVVLVVVVVAGTRVALGRLRKRRPKAPTGRRSDPKHANPSWCQGSRSLQGQSSQQWPTVPRHLRLPPQPLLLLLGLQLTRARQTRTRIYRFRVGTLDDHRVRCPSVRRCP